MIRLNALDLLERKGHTKYWLAKHLGTSGQNLNRILYNQTTSIRFETIETLCLLLECTPNELFTIDPDQPEGK